MKLNNSAATINHDIGKHVSGYMVNAIPDDSNLQRIAEFQTELQAQFSDNLWLTPPDTLHITLLDWIAPLVDYGEDKDTLFKKHFTEYDTVLSDILQNQDSITIKFDTIKVTPGAIIITASDDGSFQHIRSQFMQRVELPPHTKLPPTIIHSTIARYITEQNLQPIEKFAASHSMMFGQKVTHFRLVHEHVTPMLNYTLLKKYIL